MNASQVRAEARKKLAEKWGKAALVTLVFFVIFYVASFVLNLIPVIGGIIGTVVTLPLFYGYIVSLFKVNDDEQVTYLEFLNNGFSKFGKVWSVTLNTILKLILPIIALIVCIIIFIVAMIKSNTALILVGGVLYIAALIYVIIKQYSYKLAMLVLYDNPDMTGKEVVEKCAELMQGKVWSLFCLELSFIGWGILAMFTLGIGLIWLTPYIQVSEINFYRNLTGEVETEE